jgi:hypothetical protein
LLIASRINNNQHILNWVIGGIFTITALLQLWKILKKKDAVHQMEHPEEFTHKIEEQMDKIGKIEEGIEKFTKPDKH